LIAISGGHGTLTEFPLLYILPAVIGLYTRGLQKRKSIEDIIPVKTPEEAVGKLWNL
jgi:hypothetical protein